MVYNSTLNNLLLCVYDELDPSLCEDLNTQIAIDESIYENWQIFKSMKNYIDQFASVKAKPSLIEKVKAYAKNRSN